jgi:Spy/CpxP family protein refolding chaperone
VKRKLFAQGQDIPRLILLESSGLKLSAKFEGTMKTHRFGIFLAVILGLISGPASSQAASTPHTQPPAQAPGSSSAQRPNRAATPMDDFADLNLSEEQKAQMHKIHEDSLSRLNLVSSDSKLNQDQKAAMLDGYQRLEYTQMYEVLTLEQKAEVRKKIAARREQERHDKAKQQSSRPARP